MGSGFGDHKRLGDFAPFLIRDGNHRDFQHIRVAVNYVLHFNGGDVFAAAVGNIIGGVSSLVGIGGGTLSVPFMLWCNIPLHEAIGTSAAIGFPIAVAGTIGYVVNGFSAADLPSYSVGYVYLPALAGIIGASVLTRYSRGSPGPQFSRGQASSGCSPGCFWWWLPAC